MTQAKTASPAPGLDPVVLALRQFHQEGLERIRQRHTAGTGGLQIVEMTTGLMDEVVLRAWQHALSEVTRNGESDLSKSPLRVSLVAIGGYGRAQLHPKSDVDLLFLHKQNVAGVEEQVIGSILRTLWDVGLDVGHAARTIAGCIRMASGDLDTRTALMENRYLAGYRPLYDSFHKRYRLYVSRFGKQRFIQEKEQERQRRYQKFGHTVAIQEPDVKESAGGLRDLHHGIWLAMARYDIPSLAGIRQRGLVREPFFTQLNDAVDFLLRIRNELHLNQNASSNRLTFEVQENIAKSIGYQDEGVNIAEESLMQDYYRAATNVQQFADLMTSRVLRPPLIRSLLNYWRKRSFSEGFWIRSGLLFGENPETLFINRPDRFIRIFEIFQETGCCLDGELVAEANRSLATMTAEDFAGDKGIGEALMRILDQAGRVGPAIRAMYETGFLDVWIPEFKVVRCLPRRDLYHRYTVDEHSIITLEILDGLAEDRSPPRPCLSRGEVSERFPGTKRKWRWWGKESTANVVDIQPEGNEGWDAMTLPVQSKNSARILFEIQDLFATIEKPRLLYLATFLHDIGKGRGGDHHIKGAVIAYKVCRRLGMNAADTDLVMYLVENHLEFAKIAFRFDTQDFETIQQFGSLCDNRTKLDYLYLLTLADIWAVNTDLLTEWKLSMLHQFYRGVRSYLDDQSADVARRIEQQRKAYQRFLETLPRDIAEGEAERHISRMPSEYLDRQKAETIHEHLRLARKYTGERAVVGVREGMVNILEICTIQPSKIGNFMRTARGLSSLGLSISEARIFVRDDGLAFNTLMVVHDEGEHLREEIMERISKRVAASAQDEWDEAWDPKKQKPELERGRFHFPPQVEVDNKAVPRYMVVEVKCADAVGVLVKITSVLARYGLDIGFARIHTEGERVLDTFYVLDGDRRKFEEPQKINWLKASMIKALEEPE